MYSQRLSKTIQSSNFLLTSTSCTFRSKIFVLKRISNFTIYIFFKISLLLISRILKIINFPKLTGRLIVKTITLKTIDYLIFYLPWIPNFRLSNHSHITFYNAKNDLLILCYVISQKATRVIQKCSIEFLRE